MTPRIPLAKPEITDADREAVLAVLHTPHLSMGPRLAEFQQAMGAYLRSPSAVAVNSGTSALHLAVKCLGIPRGSEVVLPSFTFSAVLNVLLQEELIPIFAEIDPATCNLTPQTVEPVLTTRTAAIIAVHSFGRPASVDQLQRLSQKRGIFLIEDACEALGAELNGRKVGTFGDAGVFAFYPNKQITTGEGGMLVTAHGAVAVRASRLRNQGRDPAAGWLQHVETGYSYRLSEMNCALGLSQLRRIGETIRRRQALAAEYHKRICEIGEIVPPPPTTENGRMSWFCYVVQLPEWIDGGGRDQIAAQLLQKGIQTGRYFAPLHRQPVVRSLPQPSLPVTDFVALRTLALPFFNQLSVVEIEEVCDALEGSLALLRGHKT